MNGRKLGCMPNPSAKIVSTENFLPREVSGDVNVQQSLADLIDALRTSSEVHGFGGRIRITLDGTRPAPVQQPVRVGAGGSPGDWYEFEDQMSRGGSGRGGNWNDDNRVL